MTPAEVDAVVQEAREARSIAIRTWAERAWARLARALTLTRTWCTLVR